MRIKIFLIIVLFTLTIVVLVLRSNSDEAQTDVTSVGNSITFPNTQTPTTTSVTSTKGTYVRSKSGEMVRTNDFVKTIPQQPLYGEENLLLAEGKNAARDSLYQIFYYTPDGSITLVLLAEPYGANRITAESELRTVIGLSDEDMCKLDIRVMIPAFSSQELSGRNLGLSFCPFAINI